MSAFEWRRFIVALCVTCASIAILWIAVPPVYLTNDDVTIRLSLEGGLVPGEPRSGYALMTHAALGWAIAAASRVLPSAPVWDLVITGTLVCAIAILGALFWSALGTGWIGRATAAGVLAIVALPLFGSVQFTFGSTVAGIAAVTLAFAELGTRTPRKTVLLLAAALLVIGILVRPMAGTAGAISATLLLFPFAATVKRVRQVASIAAAALALYAGLQWLDTRLYSFSAEWDRFHRYNWMEAQLLEWGGPLAKGDIDAMRASTGWTPNDWEMLTGWLGIDPEIHGYERLSRAYQAQLSHVALTNRVASLASRAVLDASKRLTRIVTESGTILVVVAALAIAYARRNSAFVVGAMAALFLLLCVGIEAAFKELPFRLLAPLLVCLVAIPLVAVATDRRAPSPLVALLALSVVGAIAADRLIGTVRQLRADHTSAVALEGHVQQLRKLSPSLLVLHADAFPAEEWWKPFRRLPSWPVTIRLGDNNQNPLLQHYLSASKRQPILLAACEDPSILMVSVEERLDPAILYLREHFQMEVEWREVYSGSFTAWRCERAGQTHVQ